MNIESVPIKSLTFDPRNARKHGKKNLESIKGSLTKFGQQKPIVVDQEGKVLAGNGTLAAAKELGWKNIAVVRSDLDTVRAAAYSVADNRTSELAEWDDGVLSELLSELQLNDFDLDAIGFDEFDVKKILDDIEGLSIAEREPIEERTQEVNPSGSGATAAASDTKEQASSPPFASESPYTLKIETPVYKPTRQDKPSLSELYDTKKTVQLISEINASSLNDDVKAFLMAAAARHTIFNYENIAEYYAHSESDIQTLMEKSALVIIDFNKAIENGFVNLCSRVAAIYDDQISNGEEDDDEE